MTAQDVDEAEAKLRELAVEPRRAFEGKAAPLHA